jgi:hypothetical protein
MIVLEYVCRAFLVMYISGWHCSNYFSLDLIESLVTTTTRLTIHSTANRHLVGHFLIAKALWAHLAQCF